MTKSEKVKRVRKDRSNILTLSERHVIYVTFRKTFIMRLFMYNVNGFLQARLSHILL